MDSGLWSVWTSAPAADYARAVGAVVPGTPLTVAVFGGEPVTANRLAEVIGLPFDDEAP